MSRAMGDQSAIRQNARNNGTASSDDSRTRQNLNNPAPYRDVNNQDHIWLSTFLAFRKDMDMEENTGNRDFCPKVQVGEWDRPKGDDT